MVRFKRKPKVKFLEARVIRDNLGDFDHNAVLYIFSVDGHIVRGLHWSGKYNGSASRLSGHVVNLVYKFGLDYVTTTESQQPHVMHIIKSAFKDAGLDWGSQRAGEYAILFDLDEFSYMPKFPTKVRTITNNAKVANWQQMKVAFFNLYHKRSKRRFRIMDVHGPAGIEYGSSFKKGDQTATALKGWPKLGRIVKNFKRVNWWTVQIVVADSNGDHFLDFWLEWFEKQLGMRSIWRNNRPKYATHHGRLIDGAWILAA